MVHGDNVTIDTKLVEDKYKTGTGEVLRLGQQTKKSRLKQRQSSHMVLLAAQDWLEHLAAELVKVRAILQRNGYPRPIVDQVVDSVVNKLPVETVKRKPIYLRLPWIGSASVAFRKRIQCLTRKAVPF